MNRTTPPASAVTSETAGQATPLVVWFDDVGLEDVGVVGGKNASLGEMRQTLSGDGVRVPDGFAVTSHAYWHFIAHNGLREPIEQSLDALKQGRASLHDTGTQIRQLMLAASMPNDLAHQIGVAYGELARRLCVPELDVAVRSSATAEDLPHASFAGQQDSFLNIIGADAVVQTCQRCFASLFTDRAISYREQNGFDHMQVALSAGVQQMVRADSGAAGVMFTIDTETGFPDVVVINASWGLGEAVVKGIIDPDEFVVFKPLLSGEATTRFAPVLSRRLGSKQQRVIYTTNGGTVEVDTPIDQQEMFALDEHDVLQLARWAVAIEQRYERAMDIEWARDGRTGEMYIVQARPETVQSRAPVAVSRSYRIVGARGPQLLQGLAIGTVIASGPVCILHSPQQLDEFPDGAVLVTEFTDPDWVPAMRRAAAIITEHGGRTSHAAIVSREMNLPAIIGAESATKTLHEGQVVTVNCAEGDMGIVHDGVAQVQVTDIDLEALPDTRTPVMLNIGNPTAAFGCWRLPARGIGLARMEFIIGTDIGIHPMAIACPERITDAEQQQIAQRATGYESPSAYFVERLASGIARIAASRYPQPVLVRLSDFKTNEYRNLLGGVHFEPHENNPMIGWRGASRYTSDLYRQGFELECRALRAVRERIGLHNVAVLVPFCRTLLEADHVLAELERNGLKRGVDGLQVHVMAELPANVLSAAQFAQRFDGFSIGSNDLTQLVLGIDRDSELLAHLYSERDPAVLAAINMLINQAHIAGCHVGFCGDAPSADPEFARLLIEMGIDSISVTPASYPAVVAAVAAAEHGTPANAGMERS